MDSKRSKKKRAGSASRRGQKILLGGTRRAPKRSCGTRLADRVAETEVQRDPKRARWAHHVKSRYELLLEALEEHSKRPCGTHLTGRTEEPGKGYSIELLRDQKRRRKARRVGEKRTTTRRHSKRTKARARKTSQAMSRAEAELLKRARRVPSKSKSGCAERVA